VKKWKAAFALLIGANFSAGPLWRAVQAEITSLDHMFSNTAPSENPDFIG